MKLIVIVCSARADYSASYRYDIRAVCGVGLCEMDTLLKEVRWAVRVLPKVPLFTLQDSMVCTNDTWMLALLQNGGGFVSAENPA